MPEGRGVEDKQSRHLGRKRSTCLWKKNIFFAQTRLSAQFPRSAISEQAASKEERIQPGREAAGSPCRDRQGTGRWGTGRWGTQARHPPED